MIKKKMSGPFVAIVTLFLLAALVGCASVEQKYKKGQKLEDQGRLEEAAQRYIAVLAKDPGMEDARQRLADVGSKLVDDDLARARADEASGRFERAVEAIMRIDGLRGRAGQVGVTLPVPDDYEDFRLDTIDAAVASLFRQGEDMENAGNWAEAAGRYDRLLSYPLAPDQARRGNEARARVLIRWAEEDMTRGSFRAAYGHAQSALAIYGPESEMGAAGRAIQRAALDAGTRTVAVLPFWVAPGAGRGDAQGAGDEPLRHPPLRVHGRTRPLRRPDRPRGDPPGVEPPADPERGYPRPDGGGRRPGPGRGLRRGRLDRIFPPGGRRPQETPRTAPCAGTRRRPPPYTEKRYTAKLTGEARFRIIESVSRRVVEEETVSASASAPFRRAYFDGDYTALDLGRDERALFDREGWLRAEEELQASLVRKLAEKISSGIFERVLRYVK
ncbi:MAG: hypothetical protein MZU84_08800 [Sphingobacterium sp.]|nr:hypothetical protein [Sphingobacterium sp.]